MAAVKGGGVKKVKDEGSSLDIARLTIFESATLQPCKWHPELDPAHTK